MSRNVAVLVQSADSFEGKRSLATTRMFLFDIVERMFVRKMPELANHLRLIRNPTRLRTGFFLRADDFDAAHARMVEHGVEFDEQPRTEPYGKVAVFRDVAGNAWDLLGS